MANDSMYEFVVEIQPENINSVKSLAQATKDIERLYGLTIDSRFINENEDEDGLQHAQQNSLVYFVKVNPAPSCPSTLYDKRLLQQAMDALDAIFRPEVVENLQLSSVLGSFLDRAEWYQAFLRKYNVALRVINQHSLVMSGKESHCRKVKSDFSDLETALIRGFDGMGKCASYGAYSTHLLRNGQYNSFLMEHLEFEIRGSSLEMDELLSYNKDTLFIVLQLLYYRAGKDTTNLRQIIRSHPPYMLSSTSATAKRPLPVSCSPPRPCMPMAKQMKTSTSQAITESDASFAPGVNIFRPQILHPSEQMPTSKQMAVRKKRAIIIDGMNVGHSTGAGPNEFNCRGISTCYWYFKDRGHNTSIYLPRNWRCRAKTNKHRQRINVVDPHLINELVTRYKAIHFTPARSIYDHCGNRILKEQSHDDYFMLDASKATGAVILSNDQFRDEWKKFEQWREVIEERILGFVFGPAGLQLPMDPKPDVSLDIFLTYEGPDPAKEISRCHPSTSSSTRPGFNSSRSLPATLNQKPPHDQLPSFPEDVAQSSTGTVLNPAQILQLPRLPSTSLAKSPIRKIAPCSIGSTIPDNWPVNRPGNNRIAQGDANLANQQRNAQEEYNGSSSLSKRKSDETALLQKQLSDLFPSQGAFIIKLLNENQENTDVHFFIDKLLENTSSIEEVNPVEVTENEPEPRVGNATAMEVEEDLITLW